MIRVFLDTNILLDVLGERQPFCFLAARIWNQARLGKIEAAISAISVTNAFYILRKQDSLKKARTGVELLRATFAIVALTDKIIAEAIGCGLQDLEDAVQWVSARKFGATYIVTRDEDGFPFDEPRVLSPPDLIDEPRWPE